MPTGRTTARRRRLRLSLCYRKFHDTPTINAASEIHLLLEGLEHPDNDQAAGCAEALRQLQSLSAGALDRLTRNLGADSSPWTVWLLGHLPKELVAPSVAYLQDSAPQLRYAISVLWTFAGSWVAKSWELNAQSGALPNEEH